MRMDTNKRWVLMRQIINLLLYIWYLFVSKVLPASVLFIIIVAFLTGVNVLRA